MFWPRQNWGESKKKKEERPFPLFLFLLSPQFWRGQNIATSHGKACYARYVTYGQGNAPTLGSPQFLFLPWIRPLNLLLHLTVLWMTRLLLPIVFLFAPLLPLILYYLFLLPLLPRHCVHSSCFCYRSCFCPCQVSSWYRD